jgi:hydrogenase large subunit
MSPRWHDKRTGDLLPLDTGGGPLARLWTTALAGKVDIGYVKATGSSVRMALPKTANFPDVEFEWKIPRWSNAIERGRARTYFQAYAAAAALYFVEKALEEVYAGRLKTSVPYEDAVQNTPIFEENGPDDFKGIDILRAVRSFDPCLPCGVHMYLGPGREIVAQHSPMFGVPRNS